MKIKISSVPAEEWIVVRIVAFIRHLCPGVKVRTRKADADQLQLYLKTDDKS